ncbi:hypothetical protein HYV86_07205 [Candidatus Woesearchaeota archaeon]|nr:hypothetical protein [Candidatus Woesearchaeota archaeon]
MECKITLEDAFLPYEGISLRCFLPETRHHFLQKLESYIKELGNVLKEEEWNSPIANCKKVTIQTENGILIYFWMQENSIFFTWNAQSEYLAPGPKLRLILNDLVRELCT